MTVTATQSVTTSAMVTTVTVARRPRDPGYDGATLQATLDILFQKGYAGLTIDGVAAKTGVGRTTI